MCGIAGTSLNKLDAKLGQDVLKMSNFLSHRGPDDFGFFKNHSISLIHTRLSIIDVAGGKQPIENSNFVIAVNGEIYNDLEIRKKIKNYKYKTNSDSESILAVYNEFGIDGFDKLRGMYAFALYDKKNNQLILSRDEFGIKPLYFTFLNEGLVFSSEIQAIVNLRKKEYGINKKKLIEFLQIQYCSGSETIYKDIFRVRPGEKLIIKKGKIVKSLITNLLNLKKNNYLVSENYINNTLSESINVHQRSEVPYCLFFSGGIDSMLAMYFMSKLNLSKTKAYTVKFEDQTENPEGYLKHLSKKLNTEFLEISFGKDDFWDSLPFAAKKIDDPVADYAILPTFKLAKKASQDFKVALTGEGGDELFGGYGRYVSHMRPLIKKKKYFKGSFRKLNYLQKKLKGWNFDLDRVEKNILNLPISNLQRFQWFDYQNWLPNDLLVKLDRCLMTYGMEGRTPLVDKKVFENFFFLSDKNKISNGYGKFFIRNFLKNKLDFYDSFKKKKGFTVPIENWIPEKRKILEEFLPKLKCLQIFFSSDDILRLCKSLGYKKSAVKPLWHLIFFSAWYLVNFKNVDINGSFFDIIEEAV